LTPDADGKIGADGFFVAPNGRTLAEHSSGFVVCSEMIKPSGNNTGPCTG
jgi:hypothetical protein